jgi:hypothetical protein
LMPRVISSAYHSPSSLARRRSTGPRKASTTCSRSWARRHAGARWPVRPAARGWCYSNAQRWPGTTRVSAQSSPSTPGEHRLPLQSGGSTPRGSRAGQTAILRPAGWQNGDQGACGGAPGRWSGVSLAMGFRLSCNNQLLDLAKIVRLFKPQKKGASTGAPDPFETGKSGSAGA